MESSEESSKYTIRNQTKVSYLSKYSKCIQVSFKSDVEAFLEEFKKLESLNYADFAKLWQAKHFTLVYGDIRYIKLLKVFCDLIFAIVKKYLVFQTNVYTQIGAFYLLYGLFYKQPIRNFVQIRVTLTEYQKMIALMYEMSIKGQYDALYIFAKMKTSDVFCYVAHPRTLTLLSSATIHTENDDTFTSQSSTSVLLPFKELLNSQTFHNMERTCKDYEILLAEFCKDKNSLSPFKSTIINDMKEAYDKVFESVSLSSTTTVNSNPDTKTFKDNKTFNSRQSVRQKALKTKNAQYRGLKKVLTGLDLDDEDL